jgi:large subunit ribosomal protein L24
MKIKKGDNVIVLAGKHKGENGKVLKVFPETNRVSVEGMHKIKLHKRPRGNDKGSIVEREGTLAISNVALMDPKTGGATRVAHKVVGTEKVRIAKKSGQEIK